MRPIITIPSLPTASSDYANKIYRLAVVGADDVFYICKRTNTGSFTWIDISAASSFDPSLYYTKTASDARYYTQSQLNSGQLDSRYYTETELLTTGVLDGRYYTQTASDARYYTQTQLNSGQLDSRYYTETELLTTGVLDTRYFTQTASDARYYTKTQLDGGQLDSRYYTETELLTTGVLDMRYFTQTASDARYYTKTQLDGGQLDSRYYTETELLTTGVLDTRYYTKTLADATFAPITHNHATNQQVWAPQRSGRLYGLGTMIPIPTVGIALTANTLYYVPFYVSTQASWAAVVFEITTALSGAVQCGIYDATTGMLPLNRVAMATKTTESTTGVKTHAFSSNATLTLERWYFLALCSVTAMSIRGSTTGEDMPSIMGYASTSLTSRFCIASESLTAGWSSLPSTATPSSGPANTYLHLFGKVA